MFNVLSRRLQHCNEVAVNINNAASTQLQQIKTQLAEEMGKPVGLHTMGIPAAVSTLGVIVSFAIPQLWLGYCNSPHSTSQPSAYSCGLCWSPCLTMLMIGKGTNWLGINLTAALCTSQFSSPEIDVLFTTYYGRNDLLEIYESYADY